MHNVVNLVRAVSVFTVSVLFLASPGWCGPDPDLGGNVNTTEIVKRYLSAKQYAQSNLRGVQMEVEIDASLPKLKKKGRLQALRNISKLGTVTYRALRFTGDDSVKKDVIARYLNTENQPQDNSLSITPANYKFHYHGLSTREGRKVYVFQLSPRRKAVGLFKGELWIDADTYLPVREAGKFVKNPSVFLKSWEFVREYDILDGVAVPRHIESTANIHLFGRAELNINFSNYSKSDSGDDDVPAGGSQ